MGFSIGSDLGWLGTIFVALGIGIAALVAIFFSPTNLARRPVD
jgi:hypothetical protein